MYTVTITVRSDEPVYRHKTSWAYNAKTEEDAQKLVVHEVLTRMVDMDWCDVDKEHQHYFESRDYKNIYRWYREYGNEHFTGCFTPLLFEASIIRVDYNTQSVGDEALEELFDDCLEGIKCQDIQQK